MAKDYKVEATKIVQRDLDCTWEKALEVVEKLERFHAAGMDASEAYRHICRSEWDIQDAESANYITPGNWGGYT